MSNEAPQKTRILTIRIPTSTGLHRVAIPRGAKRLGFRLLKPPLGDPAIVVAVRGEVVPSSRMILIVREGQDTEHEIDPARRFGEWRERGHYYHAFDAGACQDAEAREAQGAAAE